RALVRVEARPRAAPGRVDRERWPTDEGERARPEVERVADGAKLALVERRGLLDIGHGDRDEPWTGSHDGIRHPDLLWTYCTPGRAEIPALASPSSARTLDPLGRSEVQR